MWSFFLGRYPWETSLNWHLIWIFYGPVFMWPFWVHSHKLLWTGSRGNFLNRHSCEAFLNRLSCVSSELIHVNSNEPAFVERRWSAFMQTLSEPTFMWTISDPLFMLAFWAGIYWNLFWTGIHVKHSESVFNAPSYINVNYYEPAFKEILWVDIHLKHSWACFHVDILWGDICGNSYVPGFCDLLWLSYEPSEPAFM